MTAAAARWAVTFDQGTAFVAGPKAEARRRLAVCGDKTPMWVNRRKAWATSPAAARGVLDQLDARNIAYAVDDTAQSGFDLTVDLTLDYSDAPEDPEPAPYWRGIRYSRKQATE